MGLDQRHRAHSGTMAACGCQRRQAQIKGMIMRSAPEVSALDTRAHPRRRHSSPLGVFVRWFLRHAIAAGALGALGASCSGDDAPPPLGHNAWTCNCDCDRCVQRDPTTGTCVQVNRTTTHPGICSDTACGNSDASDPTTKCAASCNRTAQSCTVTLSDAPDSCVNSFCSDTGMASSGLIEGDSAPQSLLVVDPALSTLFVTVSGKSAMTSLKGKLSVTGGDCPGASCPVRIDSMLLDANDVSLDDHPITGAKLINNGAFASSVAADGTYAVLPNSASFFIKFLLDGNLSGLNLAPSQPLGGAIDYNGGNLSLVATGSQGDVTVDIFLVAHYTNRPPVARAGGDLTVECTTHGGGVAALDGSASSDPDGDSDIVLHAWLEGFDTPSEVPLGTGVNLAPLLPLGDHDITLLVADHAEAQSSDPVRVSIVDTQPPVVSALSVNPSCLWPPDHRYVRFQLGSDITVATEDACDPVPPEVRIVSVVSSEPDNGTGDGDTSRDVVFNDHTVCLRSERSGNDASGRTYTARLSIADHHGNTTFRNVDVHVPHHQGGNNGEKCPALPQSRAAADAAACAVLSASAP